MYIYMNIEYSIKYTYKHKTYDYITIGFWSGARTCLLKINIYIPSPSSDELKDACII